LKIGVHDEDDFAEMLVAPGLPAPAASTLPRFSLSDYEK
jgi:hypothetical protein